MNYYRGKSLTPEQESVVNLVNLAPAGSLFVSPKSLNLLNRLAPPEAREWVIGQVTLLSPRKYQRRWARRLRSFNFGREDAYELALATFGSNPQSNFLGVDLFITFDQRLVERFWLFVPEIERRLNLLTSHIQAPYRDAMLPLVVIPDSVLSFLQSRWGVTSILEKVSNLFKGH